MNQALRIKINTIIWLWCLTLKTFIANKTQSQENRSQQCTYRVGKRKSIILDSIFHKMQYSISQLISASNNQIAKQNSFYTSLNFNKEKLNIRILHFLLPIKYKEFVFENKRLFEDKQDLQITNFKQKCILNKLVISYQQTIGLIKNNFYYFWFNLQQIFLVLSKKNIIQMIQQKNFNKSCALTKTILMIRPHQFRSNQMTLANNYFQKKGQQSQTAKIQQQSLKQFDNFVGKLREQGINVIIVQDEGQYDTPDSVFPNNWISFHGNLAYNIYPMYAQNRRLERKLDIFKQFNNLDMTLQLEHDYSPFEQKGIFLQGTGSIVLDRIGKIAFCARSPRSNEGLFIKFCEDNGYSPCIFSAYQNVNQKRELIYHTNVMMWIGEGVATVCLKSIDDAVQRQEVRVNIEKSKKQLIQLEEDQISNFAGNSIMLMGEEKIIVMSQRAYNVLTESQIDRLSKYGKIIHSDLATIEQYGGGSARCMIAEIF